MGAALQEAGALGPVRLSIFDPTGNITALVDTEVAVEWQPAVAARIMQAYPEVEQVGFVWQASTEEQDAGVQAYLRMAGGEFCGNATMSAAAWHLLRAHGSVPVDGTAWHVPMRVSGAARPVEVRLRAVAHEAFEAAVHMPQAQGIEQVALTYGPLADTVPVVRMEGISHVVIEPRSVLFALRDQRACAERAVRRWCAELGADGLGLMFLERGEGTDTLTPLVYIPGGDTVFWENSCASGSAAVGRYVAMCAGEPVSLALAEPGGVLHTQSDPSTGETWLRGTARLVKTCVL